MATTATLLYTPDIGNAGLTRFQSQLGSVSVPLGVTQNFYGGRVTSDIIAGVNRTIIMSLVPSVAATAAATLEAGSPSGSPITSIAMTNFGAGYVLPPIISTTGGGTPSDRGSFLSRLRVSSVAIVNGGAGVNPAITANVIGGMAPPVAGPGGLFRRPSCVQSVSIVNPGRRYSSVNTTVEFVGGLGPGGVAARATVSADAVTGEITGFIMQSSGSGYVKAPQVIIRDPNNTTILDQAKACANMGEGTPATLSLTVVAGVVTAVNVVNGGDGYVRTPDNITYDNTVAVPSLTALAGMGVGRIDVLRGGKGYTSAPTIVITPVHNSMFPVVISRPYQFLMTQPISSLMTTPVTQVVTVV